MSFVNTLELLRLSHGSNQLTTGEDPVTFYQRRLQRAATHAAMIALAATTFECSIAQAIRSFAIRSPERGASPEPLSLTNAIIGTTDSLSPELIPIPPRTDSPEPLAYMPRSPTPEGPPAYPNIPEYEDGRDIPVPDYPQDTPYPITFVVSELTDSIIRDATETDRQTPSPEGQQPGVHPGLG